MKAALFFFGLIALTAAQTQVSATQTVNAGTATTFSFSSSTGFAALTALLPSLSVSSNATSSVTITLGVANVLSGLVNAGSTVNFAGGLAVKSDGTATNANLNIFAGANFASTLSTVLGTAFSAVSLTVTSTNPAQLTITGTTGSFAASGNANLQVGLFTQYSDNVLGSSSSSSSSTTVTGTVPYSIAADGQTYTYTLNVPASSSSTGSTAFTAFLKPFDSSKAKSANNGGTAASSGSSSFSSSTGFIPAVFGYDFALTGGQQYAFGNNLQVTPSASSGSQGTININNAGIFSTASSGSSTSGNSAAPAAASTNGVFFNSYYQISGSGQTNVLQWSTSPSDATWTTSAFTNVNTTGSATVTTSATGSAIAAAAQAKGQAYSWYKSSTSAGAAAAANTWTKVSSTSTADASAGLKVYATVNSYSQWTVASSDSASTTVTGTTSSKNGSNAVKATLVTLIVAFLFVMF